jgi:hypothetical protein
MVTTASTGSARRRTKAEMLELDERIQPLYEQGLGCRVIGARLNEDPTVIYKRVRAMGLSRSRYEARQVAPDEPVPFTAIGADHNLRAAAVGEAIAWFLQRGYVPSMPVEPTRYDLVVESDAGLKRVQVKSTTTKERGRWVVRIVRMEYGQAESVTNGRRGRTVYRPDEVDLFFVVTSSGEKYLIPIGATSGATSLTLDEKYAAYKVEDHRSEGRERIRPVATGRRLAHQRTDGPRVGQGSTGHSGCPD